jgi:hypothetical protein
MSSSVFQKIKDEFQLVIKEPISYFENLYIQYENHFKKYHPNDFIELQNHELKNKFYNYMFAIPQDFCLYYKDYILKQNGLLPTKNHVVVVGIMLIIGNDTILDVFTNNSKISSLSLSKNKPVFILQNDIIIPFPFTAFSYKNIHKHDIHVRIFYSHIKYIYI